MQTLQISQPDNTAAPNSNLTEIVLTKGCENHQHMLLPMLAHLSQNQDKKWFTWVSHSKIDKSLLAEFSFDLSRVRIVQAKAKDDMLWLLWEALSYGNSHTVVADLDFLPESARFKLDQAAINGNTKGVILRYC